MYVGIEKDSSTLRVHCLILQVFCNGHVLCNVEDDWLTKAHSSTFFFFPKNLCSAAYPFLLSPASVVCMIYIS